MRVRGENSEAPTLIYDRFGHHDHGIEPLVIVRNFQGLRPKSVEVIEEFRLFHNLYFESSRSVFIKFDDSGDEIPVIKMFDDFVKISRKHLRQFLAAKKMSLVIYFDLSYYSNHPLVDLGISETRNEKRLESGIYEFGMNDCRNLGINYVSRSWIIGKKIIRGFPLEKCGVWPFDEEFERKFEQFVIGIDDNDDPIYYTSNPDKLSNNFGKNTHAPNFLTPVFFKRGVLVKYYNELTKYKVEDGLLRCGSKWVLQIDNNHPNYVIVFLGDLGRDLPHREQLYWKRYNVVPDGKMSETYFRRSFLAEWTEAEDNALRFQQAYATFSTIWRQQFGWHLFKPLTAADTHHFSKLRRPLTNELTELHEIVLSLSILLQDRIDKKELGKLIPGFQKKDADNKAKKNIPVLAEFLESECFADTDQYVKYLRMLQLLRSNSGAVHPRNEDEYQKAVIFFSLDSKSTTQVADEIFATLTDFLDSLRAHFCPDESD